MKAPKPMNESQHHNTPLSKIIDKGGHLVLVRRGQKSPVWSKWENRKPSLDVVSAHDGRIGLIPHSIGSTALDVDFGNVESLPRPWTKYRSRRAGGFHLYYGDDQARGNSKFDTGLDGCSGEIRGAKGYLILHPGGAEKIARALDSGIQFSLFPFPAEFLRLHETELVYPVVRRGLTLVEPHGLASPRLEGVFEGARNISLFEVVRLWAYQQLRGSDLQAWYRRVRTFALESNTRFPDRLEQSEAKAVAYSVASWVWSNFSLPPRDHSSKAQAWRGTRSGESRRKGTPLEFDRRPWLKQGISKAWWYREPTSNLHGGARSGAGRKRKQSRVD